MKSILLAAALSVVAGVLNAATYDLFDHRAGGLAGTYDYGLRTDGRDPGELRPEDFWSFESTTGASLAQLVVNFATNSATVTGKMRNNADDALWDLSVTMTGVAPIAGSAIGSFGATSYTGTLTGSSGALDIVGKAKDVNGTNYQWTLFLSDPGGNSDFRAPNITAGWLSSIDGGTSMLSGTNDFIAEVQVAPPNNTPPVPLPATGLLLIGSFGGLVALKRKQRAA